MIDIWIMSGINFMYCTVLVVLSIVMKSVQQGISLKVTTAQISNTGGGGLKQRLIACTLVILPLQTQLRNLRPKWKPIH